MISTIYVFILYMYKEPTTCALHDGAMNTDQVLCCEIDCMPTNLSLGMDY